MHYEFIDYYYKHDKQIELSLWIMGSIIRHDFFKQS